MMGDSYQPYSWAHEIVPEVLWIAMIQQGMGMRHGVDFLVKFTLEADRLCTVDPKPNFAKITSFELLTGEQKNVLEEFVSKQPEFAPAKSALFPFFQLVPESPLSFLREERGSKFEVEATKVIHDLMPRLYNRGSREAVQAMATSVYIGLRQGKLQMSLEMSDKLFVDLKAIENYPATEESKRSAGSIRALAPMLLQSKEQADACRSEHWLGQFWEQIGAFGECELPIEPQYEVEPEHGLERTVAAFRNGARKELYERLRLWKLDLNVLEFHEAMGALLARQVTLAADLAGAPQIWTPHSAPLFLRAMADVYITLAWIFENPIERSKQFIEDGQGAAKLEIAHRKVELEKLGTGDARSKAIIEYWENWLSSQRNPHLLVVNLGSWSGITTRKMAEEAGCLDFYNYVYQPFSATVHSSWQHIETKNMLYCMNPAHRDHKLAVSIDAEPSVHWPVLAAKYLKKTFDLFDAKTLVVSNLPSAAEDFLKSLDGQEL
jgi:Family of unknown function (DUF5677)